MIKFLDAEGNNKVDQEGEDLESKEEKKQAKSEKSDGKIEGIYRDRMIWVKYSDESRRFYEKSYYGQIYNDNKERIWDIDNFLVEEDEVQDEQNVQRVGGQEAIKNTEDPQAIDKAGETGINLGRDDINSGIEEGAQADNKLLRIKKNTPINKRPAFIVLEPIEALYLIERGKLDLKDESGVELDFNKLLEISMEQDTLIWDKYVVYRDIRHRGYIIRIGWIGQADFRVFERGAKFGKASAKYIYYVIKEGISVELSKLERLIYRAFKERKDLVLAIFDRLGDSTFYKIKEYSFPRLKSFDELWNREVDLEEN
ncbi:MAG: tRNA-intron lyase [Promethearchaeota archaeon]